jgi:hypothetical protein
MALLPEWFRVWAQTHLIPFLGLNKQIMAVGLLRGAYDMFLFSLLGAGLFVGSRYYVSTQYDIPANIQDQVIKWTAVSDSIARQVDIPREVPLVLWFKENSMLAINPDSCTGIIGAYDLVRSGAHPCFTPGPISDLEVREQLQIAAEQFKIRCPDITYYTQNPDTLKRCYFAYNAGAGAAARLDPNESAYVMNNYDATHMNMIYSDIELGTVEMKALGAWPAHLSFQSVIAGQLDTEARPFTMSLLYMSTQFYDIGVHLWQQFIGETGGAEVAMQMPAQRPSADMSCLGKPHTIGRPSLRPRLNPVTESPILTQDVHGCSYGLPGIDISSQNSTAVLQAPMPGEVTTYTDQWFNSTIRIENDEWIVWLLHPRTYYLSEGKVALGESVGVMGAVGIATGPHVHYVIFDKINDTFVDPGEFIP